MALIRTGYVAVHHTSALNDAEYRDAILDTLFRGIQQLDPVREAVNEAHGEGRL